MDQEKIGKFIAENRKKKNLTQEKFAERLGVTDRSVSNWENGKNMPDLSLFKPICEILGITINDLMSGEVVDNKKYTEKLEENMINTINYVDKKSEKKDRIRSIIMLTLSILVICFSEHLINNYTDKDYITIICLIIIIYSLKQLFIKHIWVRKVIALILVILIIVSLFIK